MKLTRKLALLTALIAGVSLAIHKPQTASAATYGVDWAKYQGYSGKFGYSRDSFVVSQIGGTYGGTLVKQSTYNSQVASAKANGKKVHTYIWYGVGGSTYNGQKGLNYFLPRVKTPKGSIVALDYEAGASGSKQNNTNAILAGMRQIKAAGYTPMLYSYKPYLNSYVYTSQVTKAFPNSLWVAAYANYRVTSTPNYSNFPSMNGIAIWQFTSMYRAGGLDGNVDLLGITNSGYGKASVKTSSKPTITLSANTNLRTGAGTRYKVLRVLKKGSSWKYFATKQANGYTWYNLGGSQWVAKVTTSHTYYTVKSGDSFWSIANKYGLNLYTLASQNGLSINSMIHPGTKLLIK